MAEYSNGGRRLKGFPHLLRKFFRSVVMLRYPQSAFCSKVQIQCVHMVQSGLRAGEIERSSLIDISLLCHFHDTFGQLVPQWSAIWAGGGVSFFRGSSRDDLILIPKSAKHPGLCKERPHPPLTQFSKMFENNRGCSANFETKNDFVFSK